MVGSWLLTAFILGSTSSSPGFLRNLLSHLVVELGDVIDLLLLLLVIEAADDLVGLRQDCLCCIFDGHCAVDDFA